MIWAAAAATLDQIVASTFDDVTATARGRKRSGNVNAATIDDDKREPFTFSCSLSLAPPPQPGGVADPAIRPTAGVTYAAVLTAPDSAMQWALRRDDLIEIAGAVWQVAAVAQHGNGRFVAYLNRAR